MFSFYQQSGNFAPELLVRKKAYVESDISAVVCVRAHAGNHWVLDRLRQLGDYYCPRPIFVVVDFGSKPDFACLLKDICSVNQFTYVRVEDEGVFSLSAARNAGSLRAETDLLYFTDIDFFSEPDHFYRLARYANLHHFSVIRDIVVNIPAYHLNDLHSREIFEIPVEERSGYLAELAVACAENAVGNSCEFVAPYSNNFLCTKVFFEMSGGYDTGFRGHGSEDFELMVRFGVHKDAVEFPKRVKKDMYSPSRKAFFGPRSYAGFRRLAEVDSFRAESSGFKTFHLWHPTGGDCEWRKNNDWRRAKLNKALSRVLDSPLGLAKTDHLERRKLALCVCKNPQHSGYFIPLRALGYRLIILDDSGPNEIADAKNLMEKGEINAFFIFNPYMSSHREFFELFEMAGELCEDRVVIERGALPSSVYYAGDVSYNDPDFPGFVESNYQPSGEVLDSTETFIKRITEGDWLLENSDSYKVTAEKLTTKSPKRSGLKRVFIPLQLRDDMAVNRFVTSTQNYADFEDSISDVARANPEIEIFVKPHPLSFTEMKNMPENVHICEHTDNVHALIDSCDYVAVYNSGVGLLGLIHGKKLVSVGNAFYNLHGLGSRAVSLNEVFERIRDSLPEGPDMVLMKRFLAWLISEKYSFFDAKDHIRKMRHRKSHEYEGKMITLLNWKGVRLPLGRSRGFSRVEAGSYIDGRLGLNIGRFVARGYFDSVRSMGRRFLLEVRNQYRNVALRCRSEMGSKRGT